jgi:hypothetical protein
MPIKSADTEAAVSGSGGGKAEAAKRRRQSGGGKAAKRRRQSSKAEAAKYRMREFYFISTASTIYTTLVLIVKE